MSEPGDWTGDTGDLVRRGGPVTAPQPTPDGRIGKLASICSSTPGTHLTEPISADEEAEHLLELIEAAGLLVLDPDDETTAPDSLAEFIMDNADVDVQWGSPVFDFKGLAAALQDRYLVLDPDDDEVVERISEVAEQWVDSIAFLSVDDEPTQRNSQLSDFARDILAALRGSR